MDAWADHGTGGRAVRRAEKRYNATTLVALALAVSTVVSWGMLGRVVVVDGAVGQRAVHVEGPWYAPLCVLPLVAVLWASALARRGRLGRIWLPAAVVAATPLVVAIGSVALAGTVAQHVELVRLAGLHLLALPLLVAAALTGRDALWGAVAVAAAVGGFVLATAGTSEPVWEDLVWLGPVVVVAAGAEAIARRSAALGWAAVLALVALPVAIGVVGAAVVGPERVLDDVLWRAAWFVGALGALVAGAWRESTDALAGHSALTAEELALPVATGGASRRLSARYLRSVRRPTARRRGRARRQGAGAASGAHPVPGVELGR